MTTNTAYARTGGIKAQLGNLELGLFGNTTETYNIAASFTPSGSLSKLMTLMRTAFAAMLSFSGSTARALVLLKTTFTANLSFSGATPTTSKFTFPFPVTARLGANYERLGNVQLGLFQNIIERSGPVGNLSFSGSRPQMLISKALNAVLNLDSSGSFKSPRLARTIFTASLSFGGAISNGIFRASAVTLITQKIKDLVTQVLFVNVATQTRHFTLQATGTAYQNLTTTPDYVNMSRKETIQISIDCSLILTSTEIITNPRAHIYPAKDYQIVVPQDYFVDNQPLVSGNNIIIEKITGSTLPRAGDYLCVVSFVTSDFRNLTVNFRMQVIL